MKNMFQFVGDIQRNKGVGVKEVALSGKNITKSFGENTVLHGYTMSGRMQRDAFFRVEK